MHHVDNIWVPHSVDRFTHSHKRKLPRYFSCFWNPDYEQVDAFVLTERGIITGSFPQCPLFLGLLGIGLCVGPCVPYCPQEGLNFIWPILFGLISTFAFALRKLFLLPMFLVFLLGAPQPEFDVVIAIGRGF